MEASAFDRYEPAEMEALEPRLLLSGAAEGWSYLGVAFPSWWHDELSSPAAGAAMSAALGTGVNIVEIVPTWYQDAVDSSAIYADPLKTAEDAGLRAMIRQAHAAGAAVMLKPHVDVKSGQWRGTIQPADPAAWFDSYRAFVGHFATLAAEESVEWFSVGTELATMSGAAYQAQWGAVIDSVKARYSGRLTYAANNDEYQNVSFWGRLDRIGIDAYFDMSSALPNPQPTRSQLRDAWTPVLAGIGAWLAANQPNQQVLATEIGYRSIADAQVNPWDSWRAGTYDGQVQADCYQAAIEAWSNEPWAGGMIFWTWPTDLSKDIPDDPNNTGYSPYGKPAEQVLRTYAAQLAAEADLSRVRLWDGELRDSTDPATFLLNTMGGPPVQGIQATVSYTPVTVHTGAGAYEIRTNGQIPAGGFDFVATSLTGFGPSVQYVDTRDLTGYDGLEFWARNQTGSPLDLTLEIKDYRDSNDQRASHAFVVGPQAVWTKIDAPLDLAAGGWTVSGSPDLSRAKQIAFVLKADQGQAVQGSIFLDDLTLIEPGGPLDPATATVDQLAQRLDRRQFGALWGSRDRTTGMLPAISSYADIVALNTTAAVAKMLPGAVARGWVARTDADAWVAAVVASLQTMMDRAAYLPPRYADRLTLQPAYVREESPADAAFMFLALYQYQSLPSTSAALGGAIGGLLDRFNFQAFVSPGGWKLAYDIGAAQFTAGAYDGYSGEPWLISLAAALSRTHAVPITDLWNSATNRVAAHLTDSSQNYVVHTSAEFRAPFLQWLLPLFVDVAGRGVDSYPNRALATNPYDNAVLYQRDVDAFLAASGRGLLLQGDAGDDGTGANYRQFSAYDDFGQSGLFMPWSLAEAMLGDPAAAGPSLRAVVAAGLHGPFGLVDSAQWPSGDARPAGATARNDLWNTALSTMAFAQYLYGDNSFLTALPAVDAALGQVFPGSAEVKPAASIADVRVPAGGGAAAFQVTLSQAPNGPVDVGYTTANGTATAGQDYLPASGTVHFDQGQTTATISVAVLPNALPELAETFYVDLAASAGVSVADSRGVGTILNDTTPTAGAVTLQAEAGTGGKTMMRPAALGARTRLLQQGQSLTVAWASRGANCYQLTSWYSNDGPADTLRVEIDGNLIGEFVTGDTRPAGGSPGSGWNRILGSTGLRAQVGRGTHRMTITVLQADPAGVELDAVVLSPLLIGGGISSQFLWGNALVKATLAGSGSAELISSQAPSPALGLLVAGTTAKSSLTLASTGAIDLGDIYVAGSIRAISAPRAALRGDLTILGGAGSLVFADATAGHSTTIGPPDTPRSTVAMTFARVADLSVNSRTPISSLTAVEWLATAGLDVRITAPWLGSLTTAGRKANARAGISALAGDFAAGLALGANRQGLQGVPASLLGRATIAGALTGGTWDIPGQVGSLSIARIQAAIDLPVSGVASITTSSPLVRVLEDGTAKYLVAVGEGGAIFPIHFASLARWPKAICDLRGAAGDPDPTSQDILSAMALASIENHMVTSGLGAWRGDAGKLAPGLVASYAPTTDRTYKYVAGVSYVYDDALAIQALLVGPPDAECRGRAFQIADALVLLQDRDPMNASAAADAEFPALRPAPLRDGYGAGVVAASRTSSAVTVRNVGISRTSSGNQAYVAMALLRAAGVADAAGDAARAADYRKTARELLLYVARNRLRPGPLEGFGLSNDPAIGTARATEHNVDLSAAFAQLAGAEPDAALKARWQQWRDWAESFRTAMYGPNERFGALAWIGDGWSYFRAGTDTADAINKDLIPIDAGAWSYLAQGDGRDVAFDLIEFCSTSTDAKGRTYVGFDPGFRAVDDESLTSRRDGVGAEATAYMALIARRLGDTAVLASLGDRAALTPDEQAAYDRLAAAANGGNTNHDLADYLTGQLANVQLYAPNTDGRGLVAAPVAGVGTGEDPLINGWSLAATCWGRFAYASWDIFGGN